MFNTRVFKKYDMRHLKHLLPFVPGVRMLDGDVTDKLEAQALSYKRDYIDIYSASWGPRDDGKTMEGPGHYASLALREGAEKVSREHYGRLALRKGARG